ncbi:hypothetical protein ACHAXA_002801 [Cyclostephanos tholiformis]|uniref:Uncharacterized protein n=1 Tax=Cyclostephanos tholiformis TaxID=382380 RepID=A0ABD3R2R6_9STRA
MIQGSLSPPPQMGKGGSDPPAHLPPSSLSNPAGNSANALSSKTSKPLACCLRPSLGDPSYMGPVHMQNAPTRIGNGPLTTCGRTSAVAYSSLTSKPLALARRLPANNGSSTSKPLALATRLPAKNGSSTSTSLALARRLPARPASSERFPPCVPYSYGFADAAFAPDSPARPPGDRCVRPLLHACNTSRNAPLAASSLVEAAVEQRIRTAFEADVQRLRNSLADVRRRHEADNLSTNLALVEARHHLPDERQRHEATAWAAALAERMLAEERSRLDASAWAAALAELTLAEERSRHDASARAAALAELALTEERRRHTTAAQAAESAASALANERCRYEAAAQTASLVEPELADDRLSVPPAEARPLIVPAARDTLAAPLDALLAEFAALAGVYFVGSTISFDNAFSDTFAPSGIGSNNADGSHRSSCETSPSYWPAQRSTSAQPSGHGHTLPPYPPDGGSAAVMALMLPTFRGLFRVGVDAVLEDHCVDETSFLFAYMSPCPMAWISIFPRPSPSPRDNDKSTTTTTATATTTTAATTTTNSTPLVALIKGYCGASNHPLTLLLGSDSMPHEISDGLRTNRGGGGCDNNNDDGDNDGDMSNYFWHPPAMDDLPVHMHCRLVMNIPLRKTKTMTTTEGDDVGNVNLDHANDDDYESPSMLLLQVDTFVILT